MARPSLPTLTWVRSAVTNIANCTIQEALDAIKTLLDTATYWESKSDTNTDPTAAEFAWVVMGPKGGSTTESQRIIIAFEGTSTFTGTSMVYYNEAGAQLSSPGQYEPVFNYQPEGGEVGLPPVADLDVLEPFVNRRSLGYTPCANVSSGNWFDGTKSINIWFIESDEVIAVCFENATAPGATKQNGFVAGPMWVGATDAAGDIDNNAAVPNRIWGSQSWPHNDGWVQYGWAESSDKPGNPFGTGRFQQTHHAYSRCNIFDPANNTEGLALGRTVLRFTNYNDTTVNPVDQLISQTGAMVGYDVNFYTPSGGGLNQIIGTTKYIGTWRQMRAGRSLTSRVVIDSGGTDVAIVRGPNNTNNWDSLWFTNS